MCLPGKVVMSHHRSPDLIKIVLLDVVVHPNRHGRRGGDTEQQVTQRPDCALLDLVEKAMLGEEPGDRMASLTMSS